MKKQQVLMGGEQSPIHNPTRKTKLQHEQQQLSSCRVLPDVLGSSYFLAAQALFEHVLGHGLYSYVCRGSRANR